MLKRILFLGFLITAIGVTNINAQFAGGAGTEADPYQISTVEQLQEIRNHTDKHFIQINDIDASETVAWNDSTGFLPISDNVLRFTGSYNGDGKSITNLYLKSDRESYYSLFGVIANGVVRNLTLDSLIIEARGSSAVGGIAGRLSSGTIINVFVKGHITGTWYVGGIVGQNFGGKIINSGSDVNIAGEIRQIGGITGSNSGEILSSYSWSNIFGYGETYKSEKVGGLAGENSGIIRYSYALGKIEAGDELGGLCGVNLQNGEISLSFSSIVVSGDTDVGGFVGLNAGRIDSSYWNKDSLNTGVGRGVSGEITGLKTEQMKSDSAFYYMLDLDFKSTWILTEDYPALAWQEDVEPLILPPVTPSLRYPFDESPSESRIPHFKWESDDQWTESYHIQISTDNIFENLLIDSVGVQDTAFIPQKVLEPNTIYYWHIRALNEIFKSNWTESFSFTTGVSTSIVSNNMPEDYELYQNYPNPFNPTTQIRYGIPEAGEVSLKVFNMLGQEVVTLVNGKQSAGWHSATFDASGLSSGFYIYRIQAGNFVSTKKLMLIK